MVDQAGYPSIHLSFHNRQVRIRCTKQDLQNQHCTQKFNESDLTEFNGCDGMVGEAKEHRKVDFRLEITGDDMTGLMADVVALLV